MPNKITEEKINELIKIIDSTDSSLDKQLDAIEELGELEDERARDYLRMICRRESKTEYPKNSKDRQAWPSLYSYYITEHNPHAKGALLSKRELS